MKQQILQKAIDDTLDYLDILIMDTSRYRITKEEMKDRIIAIRNLLKKESA